MENEKIGIENATILADYIQQGNITETAKPNYIVEILRFSKDLYEIVEYDARENNAYLASYSRADFIEKASNFSIAYYQKWINLIKQK
jgi:hypothetical protein